VRKSLTAAVQVAKLTGPVAEGRYGPLPAHTALSVDVDAGARTSLQVFAGRLASGDTWVRIDDVTLTPL